MQFEHRLWITLLMIFPFISNCQLTHEVYEISQVETDAAVGRVREECERNQTVQRQTMSPEDPYCLTEFSHNICWPLTPANQNATIPCPEYVHGAQKNAFAYRPCILIESTAEHKPFPFRWQFGDADLNSCLGPDQSADLKPIKTIELVTCSLSAISLVSAIFVMLYLKRLYCARNSIHINVFCAMLLRCVVQYFDPPEESHVAGVELQFEQLCDRSLATITNYATTATFSWVFVEALYLHRTVNVNVLHEDQTPFWIYFLIGWGLPAVVTTIWVIYRLYGPTRMSFWTTNTQTGKLLIVSFSIGTILVNFAIFINIIRLVLVKMKSEQTNETTRLKLFLKSVLLLLIIFGLFHVIFLPIDILETISDSIMTPTLDNIMLYYRTPLEGLQGLCASLLLCFMNEEVTTELRRLYQQWRLRSALKVNPRFSFSGSKGRRYFSASLERNSCPTSLSRRSTANV